MTRRFPRSARVRTRAEYDRIFQHGRRVALPVLALHWRPETLAPAAGGPAGSPASASPAVATRSDPAGSPSDAPDAVASADRPQSAHDAAGMHVPQMTHMPAPDPANGDGSDMPPCQSGGTPARVVSSSDPAAPRLGLAVSRKVDRRAVVRNRIKRGLREAFREHRMQLAPGEYVVVARPGAAALDSEALRRTLLNLLRRAGALPPVPTAGTMPPAACTESVQPPSR